MNPTDITNLVGSMGFPIVACGALFWMINTTMKELTGVIRDLSDSIKGIAKDYKNDKNEEGE
jgi:hypothetical protein